MNQKNIIISLIAFLVISFSFLAFSENNQHQIKNDWFLYFENPQDNSLNFIVENFSDKNNFSWSLIVDGEIKKTENLEVLKNNYKNVTVKKLYNGKEFILKVNHNNEKREVYKIFQ